MLSSKLKFKYLNKRKPGHFGGPKPLLKKRRVVIDEPGTNKRWKKKKGGDDDPTAEEDPVIEVTGLIGDEENNEEPVYDPVQELLTILSSSDKKAKKKSTTVEKFDTESKNENAAQADDEPEANLEVNQDDDQDESELESDGEEYYSVTEIPLDLENTFERHTEADVQSLVSKIDSLALKSHELKFPNLGMGLFEYRSLQDDTEESHIKVKKSLMEFDLKQSLVNNLPKALASIWEGEDLIPSLNGFQFDLLSILHDYKDLLFCERTAKNGEQIRIIYALHALNHVLKTRTKVIHHNAKLDKKKDADYRDQGLTRPKVLIVLPFRESAYRTVECLINLVSGDNDEGQEEKVNIMNHKRFKMEFASEESTIKASKPQDYNDLFSGNTDDSFRLGIAVTKKSLKLYADFYACDIIVASPLGLRLIIGAEGEKERDYDFLSSIELLILDQADVFLMQNWEHVLDIMNHMHLTPVDSHGVDFSRVRMWALEGHYKYYRQTAIFSSINTPQITSLFKNRCHNYEGRITIRNPIPPTADQLRLVYVQCPQSFYRFESKSLVSSPDERFKFFTETILPKCREIGEPHTMIFIPSYFDYVKLRNYFRQEDINFTQICEYTKRGKTAQSRTWFFHGGRNFLLYTERCHFYNRYRIKGIRHLVFYQLPMYPHFYSEMCNLLHPGYQGKKFQGDDTSMNCTILYDKFDYIQLEAIVGTEKAAYLIKSELDNHVFISQAKK